MKEHYQQIYARRADDYHRLVSREDHQGALLPAIRARCALKGARVVEFGAGTGRLTRLLAPHVARIEAFDAAAAMLDVATQQNERQGIHNVSLAVAEHHDLPIDSGQADLALEGWAFGHLMDEPDWRRAVDAALQEMDRVTRPGGAQLLIETLGTGRTEPEPPSPALVTLFDHLESMGFVRHHCRTDYRFESRAEANELVGFFFGAEMLTRVGPDPRPVLPECTGLWVRRLAAGQPTPARSP